MKRILVVDDMAVFREPIARALRAEGYETLCAENGEQALRMLRQHGADLVLLDVAMPVMDGLGFLAAIRHEDRFDDLPVLLLTAVAERDYVIKAAKYGAREYLLKSRFSLETLIDRIEKRLAERPGADGPTGRGLGGEASHDIEAHGSFSWANGDGVLNDVPEGTDPDQLVRHIESTPELSALLADGEDDGPGREGTSASGKVSP